MKSAAYTPAEGSPGLQKVIDDPLRAYEVFAFRQTFYPFGFPVEFETNDAELLRIAAISWSLHRQSELVPALKLRIGVTGSTMRGCPRSPAVRGQCQLLSIVSDPDNFIICDLQGEFAFGWIGAESLLHAEYLRYCFLDCAVMLLLSGRHVVPLHAATVSFAGRGLLLHGPSGAGKSTLAYACARQGWTYTTDDSSYLLWGSDLASVRGDCHKFRFRPTAVHLFPELWGRSLAPRLQGKPSIEVPTSELNGIASAQESVIHAFVSLQRHDSSSVILEPLAFEEAAGLLESSLLPLPEIRELQRAPAQRVLRQTYTLRYRDLDPAIACLRELAMGISR